MHEKLNVSLAQIGAGTETDDLLIQQGDSGNNTRDSLGNETNEHLPMGIAEIEIFFDPYKGA